LCWLTAIGTGVGVVYGIDMSPIITQDFYSTTASAFYGGFHRLAWGLALGWVVFACSRGYGGIIQSECYPITCILRYDVVSPYASSP